MTRRIHLENSGTGNFPNLTEAIALANQLLADDEFYVQIASHILFDQSNVPPYFIATLMSETRLNLKANLYYALNPLKNIDGYDDHRHPELVHLNIWQLDRPAASICNTLIHATVHAVDAVYKQCYFGHVPGTAASNANTAPYRIGAIAQAMVGEGTALLPLEHDMAPRSNTARQHLGTGLYTQAGRRNAAMNETIMMQ